jgi:septal ring factor EnvC (AmiA/AmiB activator)
MKNVSFLTHVLSCFLDQLTPFCLYHQAQTEESMRIERLHRDTSQVERQIHEKTHYTRRLEHMLSRLKTNQVSFVHMWVAVTVVILILIHSQLLNFS